MPTMFSRIISGEIPSYKIYEDEYTFAFLDIFPYQPGHTLIVPRIEIDYFVDVPEPYYSPMIYGLDVPHFHYHLIPVHEKLQFPGKKTTMSKDQMLDIQAKIVQFL
jgi:histidine triad (HIT) family protein